jgi:squalene-hopene/tetraprenyl-beta-curcumene cyclase
MTALEVTLATLTKRLLDLRNSAGHWEGFLSSSALSTATASFALALAGRLGRGSFDSQVARAHGWLEQNQNPDGGWGDTVISHSNVSTTALCWAALSGTALPAEAKASHWLHKAAGGLDPEQLRQAILRRYGNDRTFSVPILTVLAIAGKVDWRRVPQLPFELAACPHQMFQWLRLPVVSYALPALIAIGQARHRNAPTANPLTRGIRSLARARTLASLRAMQPESGGYLEATPLTSFVVMSLLAAGETDHPVVEHGLQFLLNSQRPDGSWPIDTNLATWVTTLSVNVLAGMPVLSDGDRDVITGWLLGQQAQIEHPYTHAAPGGWAWTDLSGGVPDADDTAGALLALRNLGSLNARTRSAAGAGVRWLLGVQNSDGGIPTFCRGWGALPFDRSAPDLTAHAIQAWSAWQGELPSEVQIELERAARRAVRFLIKSQHPDGSWSPLWFGNQEAPGEDNPVYGASRVLLGLASPLAKQVAGAGESHRRGIEWLMKAQNADGGFGGAPGTASSIEETGLALQVLTEPDARQRAAGWIIQATGEGRQTPASPIGLYFARLWYFEELYPLIFSIAGLLSTRSFS